MYIRQLIAKNFRNYQRLVIDFHPGINIIYGPNAAGKTNIIEAISILSNIKSFRGIHDSAIIKWGEQSYYCCSTIEKNETSKFEIGFSLIHNKQKKRAKIDDRIINKMSEYYGKLITVIFSTEDINIIHGPPETRRKFFDGMISKIDQDYLNNLYKFKKINSMRNKILKVLKEKSIEKLKQLDVLDEMFAIKASFLLKKRKEFINNYNPIFGETYHRLFKNCDSLNLKYKTTLDNTESTNIIKNLKYLRKKDILKGFSSVGPHIDDYIIENDKGYSFNNYASQGQKRIASISLKVAECNFIEIKKKTM